MSDSFTMTCPKCSSTGLERFQDRATSWGHGLDNFALKCRTCGKVLYGEVACQAEYDQQYAAWLAEQSTPARKAELAEAARLEQARLEQERRIIEADRNQRAQRQRAQEESRRRQEEVNRAWAAQAARQRAAEQASVEAGTEKSTPGVCAWKDCEEPARTTSIYCSRGCSNKNARWRHKLRETDNSQAA